MQASKAVSVIFIIVIFVILQDLEKTPYAENNYLSTNPYGVYWKGNAFYFNNNATGDINKPKQPHDNDDGEQFSFMFKIPPDYINRFSNSPDIWIKLLRPSIDNPNCELELRPSFIKITRDKWEKVEKFGPDTDEYENSSAVPIKLVGSKPSSFDIFRIDGDKLKLQPRDEVVLGFVYHRTGKIDACEENFAIHNIQIKWGFGEELF
jgi:hypothetical protein